MLLIIRLYRAISEPTFHVPTEANAMTPERFHDFLSLASSPPLPSSFLPRPLPSTPPGRHSHTEGERGSGERGEQSVENDNVPSAPSFAQVSNHVLLIHCAVWLKSFEEYQLMLIDGPSAIFLRFNF